MSSKLDRSLDEILADRPRGGGRGRGSRASGPAGGIRKRSQRGAAQKANASIAQTSGKLATKAPPTGPSGKVTASKIIVSNLVSRAVIFLSLTLIVILTSTPQPFDVTEQMIKVRCLHGTCPFERRTRTIRNGSENA
jgi:THO complex subunit 4